MSQIAIEVIDAQPRKKVPGRPPLLFIHGAYCGAWAWNEHFLPYFAKNGWRSYALSLRGHGKSGGEENLHNWSLCDYVADVEQVVDGMEEVPILVGHSMGAAVAQLYAQRRAVPGMALLHPVPPEGLFTSSLHMSLYSPNAFWQLGVLQAWGHQAVSPEAVFPVLFSEATPQSAVMRYLPLMQKESARALFELMTPGIWPACTKAERVLVMGGEKDRFIPADAVRRAAWAYGVTPIMDPDVPHVMLLDALWRRSADPLLDWLEDVEARAFSHSA
ncbi:alpha/beta hydrolase [Telmatospirillum sp. J64-1]|uniref:alpha/beta hydrolase n=1 Tax=Telmatospirillum sp. J64-1 TaxID=2502183 RepID=UPI00163D73BF|nr:alpha/beta fold hydrolase [Telmatospirillum sp. J64-1]